MHSEPRWGELVAMWLWVQTGDRLAGLMRFDDIIREWDANDQASFEMEVRREFERQPEATVLFNPGSEARAAAAYTKRVLLASLFSAASSQIENLSFGLCQMLGLHLKKRPHWDDSVKRLKNGPGIDLTEIQGFWAVKRIRLLSNCFKHNDGCVNEDYAELVGSEEGEEIAFEHEDAQLLLNVLDSFLNSLRDRVSRLP